MYVYLLFISFFLHFSFHYFFCLFCSLFSLYTIFWSLLFKSLLLKYFSMFSDVSFSFPFSSFLPCPFFSIGFCFACILYTSTSCTGNAAKMTWHPETLRPVYFHIPKDPCPRFWWSWGAHWAEIARPRSFGLAQGEWWCFTNSAQNCHYLLQFLATRCTKLLAKRRPYLTGHRKSETFSGVGVLGSLNHMVPSLAILLFLSIYLSLSLSYASFIFSW